FDLLCNLAYNSPLRTRRERAERIVKEEKEFFTRLRPEAQQILKEVLLKYIEYGATQLDDTNVLKIAPISNYGNVMEISEFFTGPEHLKETLGEMQSLLYNT